jgi:hypothetical protein
MNLEEAARALELSLDDVKKLRKTLLEEGVDYTRNHYVVTILPPGLEKMRAHVALALQDVKKDARPVEVGEGAVEAAAAPPGPPAPDLGLQATVERTEFPRRDMIQCRRMDRLVRVMVHAERRHLFAVKRPPQVIHLIHMQGDVYKVSRYPRRRGDDA